MEKLPAKRSLFDTFLEEINDEESISDFPNNETSIEIEEKIWMEDENSSTNSKDAILNEHNCDINIMLKAFDDAFETMYGNNEVSSTHIQKLSEEFQENCVHMINTIKTQSELIEIEKSKYNVLENESTSTINKLQLEVAKLNFQLKQQSSFSSFIGSTLCYYLWKATEISSVIDLILQKDNITNMATFIANILSSFIKSYEYQQMPSIQTKETQFVLQILRILANLTTTKSGCHFFSQVNDGINIVNLIVTLVLCTPPSNNILKNIAYATLYNVSIQFNGYLLMKNSKLIQTLQNDIKVVPTRDNNTILFSLNLLLSLSRKMDKSMYLIFKNEINLQEILKLTKYTETELIARKIFDNINIASKKFTEKSE
ncbi:unnamed protein product [Aphis gossypii]|uniref:Uncharacterized protein n=1 Tax=Aphis gossypii TaxID=80765 RepID=A0A9P0NLP3_APHGO|nr:unnamed protein product [Aphis gossypii]